MRSWARRGRGERPASRTGYHQVELAVEDVVACNREVCRCRDRAHRAARRACCTASPPPFTRHSSPPALHPRVTAPRALLRRIGVRRLHQHSLAGECRRARVGRLGLTDAREGKLETEATRADRPSRSTRRRHEALRARCTASGSTAREGSRSRDREGKRFRGSLAHGTLGARMTAASCPHRRLAPSRSTCSPRMPRTPT
eukprot:5586621-Prymnesium_polylepis.1